MYGTLAAVAWLARVDEPPSALRLLWTSLTASGVTRVTTSIDSKTMCISALCTVVQCIVADDVQTMCRRCAGGLCPLHGRLFDDSFSVLQMPDSKPQRRSQLKLKVVRGARCGRATATVVLPLQPASCEPAKARYQSPVCQRSLPVAYTVHTQCIHSAYTVVSPLYTHSTSGTP